MTSTPTWFKIASPVFLQFECVHHPVLYLCLNKTLRREFKNYMIKLIAKITGKDLTSITTMVTTSSTTIFINRWRVG
uniref:Uncharacterized protein n=1 Tax=Acrobeloides nanus TaxID=290746 RepID=A0A914CIB1_9BILA